MRLPGIRPRVAVGLIAVTAFFVRLLHVLSYESAPTNDMSVYVDMAVRRLSLANLFSMDGLCWFPPGYALFLKPFFLLFAHDAALVAVKIAQAALGAWTCVLVYRLARRSHTRLAGLAAALVTAFYPHFIFYSSAYMSETLFIAIYFAALLIFLRAAERPRRSPLYAAGLVAGAAMLVRPVAVSLAPAALAAAWSRAPDLRGRLRALGLVLAGALTLIGPWTIRNQIAYGHPVLIAPNGPFNLAIGNHAGASGRYTTPPSIQGNLWARMDDFRDRALHFAETDPWGELFVTFRLKWLAFWELIPPWPLYSSNPQLYYGGLFFPWISWRVAAVLGTLGLGVLLARGRRGWWIAPCCLVLYVGVYLVFFGNARFRLPAEGFFLAWSGVALARLARASRRLRRLSARGWSTIACAILALVLVESGLEALRLRAALRDPGGVLAAGDQFPVIRSRPVIPVFGTEPIPVERERGRFLQFSMQAWRMGPPRDTPDNGSVRIQFFDGGGRRLSWLDNPRFFLEALPADRWVPVTFRTHIPPAARTLEVSLIPDPGSPDTLIVDQPVLRYSPGNDPALESLFPYQRYQE